MACMKIRLKRKFDRGKLRYRGVQGYWYICRLEVIGMG